MRTEISIDTVAEAWREVKAEPIRGPCPCSLTSIGPCSNECSSCTRPSHSRSQSRSRRSQPARGRSTDPGGSDGDGPARLRFRTIITAVSREAGHKPMSPLKAIRAKCYDCSYFQLNEIRLCEAVNCALWPFRAGKHPWRAEARKTPLTDANSHRQTASEDEGSVPDPRRMPNSSATPIGCRDE